MLVYPLTLPEPDVSGNSTTMSNTFARTQLPYAIEQRALFGENVKINFSFTCENRQQVRDFTVFYYTTTLAGTLPFTADWSVYGNAFTKAFRFSDVMKTTALGSGVYKVDCQFELLPNLYTVLENEPLFIIDDLGNYVVDDSDNQVTILRSAL